MPACVSHINLHTLSMRSSKICYRQERPSADGILHLSVVAEQWAYAASGVMSVHLALTDPQVFMQLEGIALDPDAENGVASIGSMDANNLAFTQTQGTQASQVCIQPQNTLNYLAWFMLMSTGSFEPALSHTCVGV